MSQLGKLGTPEETAFRRAVYDRQLELTASNPKRVFSPGLSKDELAEVGGSTGFQMRAGVEGDARDLLSAARADLRLAQAKDNLDRKARAKALRVKTIGFKRTYTGLARESSNWKNAYATHFERTKKARAALKSGAYGKAAVEYLARRLMKWKAIPGYSLHTKGLAIDFMTTEGKTTYAANSSQKASWKRTWLYSWLVAHAKDYGFSPYWKEPWHWQHDPPSVRDTVKIGGCVYPRVPP